jgi:membrane protein implicated in regulation of membrane protease activity
MPLLRTILLILGVACAAMGLLWIAQGLGYVHWPASSFMLDQRPWADRGAALAVAGLLLLLVARRLPRR